LCVGRGSVTAGTGSPGAVARLRLLQNVACGFTVARQFRHRARPRPDAAARRVTKGWRANDCSPSPSPCAFAYASSSSRRFHRPATERREAAIHLAPGGGGQGSGTSVKPMPSVIDPAPQPADLPTSLKSADRMQGPKSAKRTAPTPRQQDEGIEEATLDCYNEGTRQADSSP
jgi:hypothetical protein